MGFGARSGSVSRPSRKVNDDAARSRCLGLGLWSKRSERPPTKKEVDRT
jgi:hypothetical protein